MPSPDMKIVGLTGLSGVGKGYSKEYLRKHSSVVFSEPVVVTTRPPRLSDGSDRQAGLKVEDFLGRVSSGEIVFAHRPFGADWYGFNRRSMETESPMLTEVHVDNVIAFRNWFGLRLLLLGLIASEDYLYRNLEQRGTESQEAIALRLAAALEERERIVAYHREGLIKDVFEVNSTNRQRLGPMLVERVLPFLTTK